MVLPGSGQLASAHYLSSIVKQFARYRHVFVYSRSQSGYPLGQGIRHSGYHIRVTIGRLTGL